MSDGVVKAGLVEDCHLTTEPVCPDKVSDEGVKPAQMVWFAATVPPTVGLLIVKLEPLSVPMVAGAGLVTLMR